MQLQKLKSGHKSYLLQHLFNGIEYQSIFLSKKEAIDYIIRIKASKEQVQKYRNFKLFEVKYTEIDIDA